MMTGPKPPSSFRNAVHALTRTMIGAMLVAVAGCTTTQQPDTGLADPPRPQAKLATGTHVVTFPAGSARLDRAERQQLAEFLARADVAAAEGVRVTPGWGAPEALARLRRQEVAALVRQAGGRLAGPVVMAPAPAAPVRAAGVLAANALADPLPVANVPANKVVVTVRRYVVVLPHCPDWTGDPSSNFDNRPSTNWGCATAVNLGVMIADPRDLMGGNQGPADGERLARSIERYREDRVRALIDTGTSDVAPPVSAAAGGSDR